MKYKPHSSCLYVLLLFVFSSVHPTILYADDDLLRETRIAEVRDEFGLTGKDVIIAILDRGIDYEHPDFQNEDGTSRILYIYDMTDDSGANDADNPFDVGTVYTRSEINEALSTGTRLATRDAVGHGTTTAGLAGGNGRASDGLYEGAAPNAQFIIVKFTTEGAVAHGDEPAEAPFFQPALFPIALDFVIEKAEEVDLPFVALANFGSVGAIPDGQTTFARAIDERFGADKPGRVFVTGSSDDGGADNHASGNIAAGQTIDLEITKGVAGNLRLQFWYPGEDGLDIEVISPTANYGPYVAPDQQSGRDTQVTGEFTYYHNGTEVDFAGTTGNYREVLVDFSGPVGSYTLRLTGRTVTDGTFHAWLNPSRDGFFEGNQFETFVVPGYTVWEAAAAFNNISPNSYVLRHEWDDVDGNPRGVNDQGAIGDLWTGSGVGPTLDGRYGITVSAPGERLFAPYGPRSYYATFRFNVVYDDGNGGMYGIQSAVSAANPVVTGIIALLLEANPDLDATEVQTLLQQTARQDAFTGEVPNNRWGYGKIDAYEAAKALQPSTSTEEAALLSAEKTFTVDQFPNPFSAATTIQFTLQAADNVKLVVYDMLGREVSTLVNKEMLQGAHEAVFDASALPAGAYVFRLEVGEHAEVGVMTAFN